MCPLHLNMYVLWASGWPIRCAFDEKVKHDAAQMFRGVVNGYMYMACDKCPASPR